jgi:hypothetical protein
MINITNQKMHCSLLHKLQTYNVHQRIAYTNYVQTTMYVHHQGYTHMHVHI